MGFVRFAFFLQGVLARPEGECMKVLRIPSNWETEHRRAASPLGFLLTMGVSSVACWGPWWRGEKATISGFFGRFLRQDVQWGPLETLYILLEEFTVKTLYTSWTRIYKAHKGDWFLGNRYTICQNINFFCKLFLSFVLLTIYHYRINAERNENAAFFTSTKKR